MSAALDEAYKKAGDNAYFANGFALGVEFALQQVKSVDLADVGGSLPTCTLLEREDVMFGKYKLTSCCKQGPVTQENYCPNCGAKIERQ